MTELDQPYKEKEEKVKDEKEGEGGEKKRKRQDEEEDEKEEEELDPLVCRWCEFTAEEEETDSEENEPAMSCRLQRQQSSRLLLNKVLYKH